MSTTTTLPAGPLLRALAPMIYKRPMVPALGCVLVTPTGLAAFDYETTRTWSADGTTSTTAPFLVPAAALADAVKGATSGMTTRARELAPVTVTATSTGATVTANGVTVPLTLPTGTTLADHPDLPPALTTATGAAFTMTADDLAAVVAHVAPATCSPGEIVPILTAVHLAVDDLAATWTATDRYRAHRLTTTSTDAGRLADPILVPAAFLVGFYKLVKGDKVTGPVTVTAEPVKGTTTRRLSLSAGGHTWSTTMTEGQYPVIGRIVDQAAEGETRGQVPADMLAAVVKRAAALVDRTRGRLLVDSDGDVVRVAADMGADVEPVLVGVVPTSVPAFDVTAVNAGYLLGALAGHAGAVDTVLTWSGASKPLLLTSGPVESLVMPTRGAHRAMPATPATMTAEPTPAPVVKRPARTTSTPAPTPAPEPVADDGELARLRARVAELETALAAATATPEPTTSTATSTPATTSAGGEHKHRALPGDDVPPRCACGFRQSRTPSPGRSLVDHLARFRNR